MSEYDLNESVSALKNTFGFEQGLTEPERRQLRAAHERDIVPRQEKINKIYEELADQAEKRKLAELRLQREQMEADKLTAEKIKREREAELRKELMDVYARASEEVNTLGQRPNMPVTESGWGSAAMTEGLPERAGSLVEQEADLDSLRASYRSPEVQYKLRTLNDSAVTAMFEELFTGAEKSLTSRNARNTRNIALNKRVDDIVTYGDLSDENKTKFTNLLRRYKEGTVTVEQLENNLSRVESGLTKKRKNITFKRKRLEDFIGMLENPVGVDSEGNKITGYTSLGEIRKKYDPAYIKALIIERIAMYDKDQITMEVKPDDKGNIFSGSVANDDEEMRRVFGLNKEGLQVVFDIDNVRATDSDEKPTGDYDPEGLYVGDFKSIEGSAESKLTFPQKVNKLVSTLEVSSRLERQAIEDQAGKLGVDSVTGSDIGGAGEDAVSRLMSEGE